MSIPISIAVEDPSSTKSVSEGDSPSARGLQEVEMTFLFPRSKTTPIIASVAMPSRKRVCDHFGPPSAPNIAGLVTRAGRCGDKSSDHSSTLFPISPTSPGTVSHQDVSRNLYSGTHHPSIYEPVPPILRETGSIRRGTKNVTWPQEWAGTFFRKIAAGETASRGMTR